ncbi:MAG: hypothetical protein R3B70_30835 [Polyangiaceae bacterium]
MDAPKKPPSPPDEGPPLVRARTVAAPVSAQPQEALPFAPSGQPRDPGSPPSVSGAALPFQRSGLHAFQDLGSSQVSAPPPSSAAPGYPPARPSDPGMPPRAFTMDMPSGAAALGLLRPTPASSPQAQPAPQASFAQPAPPAPPVARPAPPAPPARPAKPAPVASPPPVQMPAMMAPPPMSSPTPAASPQAPSPAPRRQPSAAARDRTEALVLLWLDPAAVPRMRKKPAFRDILDALEEQDPDTELDASFDGFLADIDDQRAVFEILAKGDATDDEGLQRAMREALREDGKFVPPLVLLSGEIAFSFDELELLRATVITVGPLASAEEPLKAALDTARDFLSTPDLACSPAVAEGMIQRIRDAFSQGRRVVPPGYLEAQTERMLLEQRRYQKRTVFGGPQLRGLVSLAGGPAPVPAYIPAQAASKLPLYQRFRVRLLATAHVAEDQNETHPIALKVLAFARIAPAPGSAPIKPSSSPRS